MKFLIAIHRPNGYDGSKETKQMGLEIDQLNDEMKASGVRILAMGLKSPTEAKSLRAQEDGRVVVTDGPFLETKEHVGGFWILECADVNEAVEWGQKAVGACKANVEVRPMHG